MEQWLKEAKALAQSEAKDFIENMNTIASKYDLEPEWFIEEVVKNIHQIKNTDNRGNQKYLYFIIYGNYPFIYKDYKIKLILHKIDCII